MTAPKPRKHKELEKRAEEYADDVVKFIDDDDEDTYLLGMYPGDLRVYIREAFCDGAHSERKLITHEQQSHVDRAQSVQEDWLNQSAIITELEQENARLRAALERIALREIPIDEFPEDVRYAVLIARQATKDAVKNEQS